MKKNILRVWFLGLIMGFFPLVGFAEEITVSTPQADVTGSVNQSSSNNSGVTVTRDPAGMTLTGVSPSVSVDNRNVQGAEGTLRIRWNTSGRDRGSIAPPGAPELPANVMFGSGLFFLGFGLLLYRKLW